VAIKRKRSSENYCNDMNKRTREEDCEKPSKRLMRAHFFDNIPLEIVVNILEHCDLKTLILFLTSIRSLYVDFVLDRDILENLLMQKKPDEFVNFLVLRYFFEKIEKRSFELRFYGFLQRYKSIVNSYIIPKKYNGTYILRKVGIWDQEARQFLTRVINSVMFKDTLQLSRIINSVGMIYQENSLKRFATLKNSITKKNNCNNMLTMLSNKENVTLHSNVLVISDLVFEDLLAS
jgi:hypothetical protein